MVGDLFQAAFDVFGKFEATARMQRLVFLFGHFCALPFLRSISLGLLPALNGPFQSRFEIQSWHPRQCFKSSGDSSRAATDRIPEEFPPAAEIVRYRASPRHDAVPSDCKSCRSFWRMGAAVERGANESKCRPGGKQNPEERGGLVGENWRAMCYRKPLLEFTPCQGDIGGG